MSNRILSQLIELFPAISEEFLSGIYDAHKDEEATIEELIDVILSFEFPPPRETTDEHSSVTGDISPDGPDHSKLEMQTVINSSEANQPIEKEVELKPNPEVNGVLPSEGKELLMEELSDAEQYAEEKDLVHKETPNGVLYDNKKINDSFKDDFKIKVEPSSNVKLEITSDSVLKIQSNEIITPITEMNNSNLSTNHEESEDDSSPECSIKYLMKERNVLERYNIGLTTHVKQLTEENSELVSSSSELINNSSCTAAHVLNNAESSSSKNQKKQKRACQFRKRSTCSSSSQNSLGLTLPHSNARSVRSSKIKNEEERLRRKLINQSRLLRKNQERNKNSIIFSSQFLEMDKKYSLLCSIFTDAEPTYLLSQCNAMTDHETLLSFISENLEFRDYPKMEVIKEEPRLMEKFHCTIEQFLEVISDPVAEFSSTKYIRAGYEENAEIYLNARYDGLTYEDARERLRANKYNLTNVCIQLEEEGRIPTQGVLDYTPLHHSANVFFHQEVWYIEHRNEVQEYLESAIEAIRIEEELNRPPTPPEEVFECQICADEIYEYKNLGTCDGPTGHLFCNNCIKRSVEIRIGDGETSFPCLVNCGSSIPLQTVEELLPNAVFDKLMGRIQEEEIRKANIAGIETCPFCPYAFGPGEDMLFTCLNPGCMKVSCRICRKEDHSPEMCAMFKNEDEERARHIIEDRMAEALMRTCYSCGKNFVKSTGCNKMQCTCGAKMCYVCRQPVVDYSHFNGPGGDNTDRCPLFSQDDELHDRPVEATAQQVFNEIAANNPQLNLDRAKLIPN